MCIGSWETPEDIHTTVCNDNYYFLYATDRTASQWTTYYTWEGTINCIVGLGKQTPSSQSTGFLSYAVSQNQLSSSMYSVSLDSQLVALSSGNAMSHIKKSNGDMEAVIREAPEHLLGREPFKFSTMATSMLTLGGYDELDLKNGSDSIAYYDTSACDGCWNIIGSYLYFGDLDIIPEVTTTGFTVNFQLGFPYIGLNKHSWDLVTQQINTLNPDYTSSFTCETYANRNSVCYWQGVQCSQLNLDFDLVIKVGSSIDSITGEYTLSLKALTTDVTQSTRTDCDMFLTEMHDETANMVILGDPWLAAFMPIFDVDND